MFGIGISCLVQNEDTSVNKDSHSSCNCCVDSLTSVIAFTIS